jgi:glutamyl-tRNA synthetase
MTVVTRFAPSPTGFLHIGGARTALFNWLYARGGGGSYLLRIEDTDRARSTPEATAAILEGLNWLGLDADGQTIYQSTRADLHRQAAEAMVERGTAFRCYVTPEELEARRNAGAAARAKLNELLSTGGGYGQGPFGSGPYGDPGAPSSEIEAAKADVQRLTSAFRSPYRDGMKEPAPDEPYVIRLRAPDSGDVINDDLVQGQVRTAARDIDDLVLLRADGSPTYMLSVVVDDHDMGVTHVIRGDDHLTNAARQIPIFDAMGWKRPAYAHIPLIHGPDGAKLSKRHGAQAVHEYRDMGYLPEALLNYLARLGWSHGDDEIFSLAQAAAWFDVKDVNKGAARLDFDKLASVNAHYLREADDGRLGDILFAFISSQRDWPMSDVARTRVRAALPALKGRAKTVADLAEQAFFLIRARPLPLDATGKNAIKDEDMLRLRRLKPVLDALTPWNEAAIAAARKGFAESEGVGLGKIGPPLRTALTAGAPAPDLAQTLAFLGKEETLGRLADRVEQQA